MLRGPARPTPAELGLDVETVATDAERLPFRGRELRPGPRPRRAPSHPRPRPGRRRVPPGPAARRHGRLLRRALRATATGSPRSRSARRIAAAPVWRRAGRRRPASRRRRSEPRLRPRARGRGRRPRLRARDGSGAMLRSAPASTGSRIRGEELLANALRAGAFARSSRPPSRTRSPSLAPLRLPQLPRPAEGRQRAARAAPAAGALLQPRLLGAPARLTRGPTDPRFTYPKVKA